MTVKRKVIKFVVLLPIFICVSLLLLIGPIPSVIVIVEKKTYETISIPQYEYIWKGNDIHNYSIEVDYNSLPMCLEDFTVIVRNDIVETIVYENGILTEEWSRNFCQYEDLSINGIFESSKRYIIQSDSCNNIHLVFDNKMGYITEYSTGCITSLFCSPIADCGRRILFTNLKIL